MNRYVLDTSFLQSLFDETDSNATKAIKIWKEFDPYKSKFIIPQIVVVELLIGEKSESTILNCTDIVKKFEINTNKDLEFISSLEYSTRKKLKSNDCLILALTVRNDAHLITFDRKLQKAHTKISQS